MNSLTLDPNKNYLEGVSIHACDTCLEMMVGVATTRTTCNNCYMEMNICSYCEDSLDDCEC